MIVPTSTSLHFLYLLSACGGGVLKMSNLPKSPFGSGEFYFSEWTNNYK